EIKELFEIALSDMKLLGAEIIDPFTVPNFENLRKDQWCATFRQDLESFLENYVKKDTLKTLEDIIRIGTTSEYSRANMVEDSTAKGRWGESDEPCLDAYHDGRRIAFREAIENVMDSLELDAIVYPTWNNKPAHIDKFNEEYRGDNSQVISPHTGQPAFTVPMGFTSGMLPAGLQFLGRMYHEPTLIKLTYAYEQGTKHRKPPTIEEK
ncbi:MAG: amidase family protein, partial [Pricia sp.]